MKINYASIDITPNEDVVMGGYGNLRSSVGIHDPITAQILIIDNIVFISLDWVAVDRELRNLLKTKDGSNEYFCFATHTHSGPGGTINNSLFENTNLNVFGKTNLEYLTFVAEKIVSKVQSCKKKMLNFRYRLHIDSIEGVFGNRHNKFDTMPYPIYLIEFSLENNIQLLLTFYGCHPTVLNSKNQLISSDIIGNVRSKLLENYAFIFFGQTASGDISTRFWKTGNNFDTLDDIGSKLYNQIISKLNNTSSDFKHLQSLTFKEYTTKFLDISNNYISFSYTTLLIDGINFVLLPFEVYSSISEKIYKETSYTTLSLANGYYSYLVDEEGYNNDHYESSVSLLNYHSTQVLIDSIVKQLKNS